MSQKCANAKVIFQVMYPNVAFEHYEKLRRHAEEAAENLIKLR
jgi:hypothetical protein